MWCNSLSIIFGVDSLEKENNEILTAKIINENNQILNYLIEDQELTFRHILTQWTRLWGIQSTLPHYLTLHTNTLFDHLILPSEAKIFKYWNQHSLSQNQLELSLKLKSFANYKYLQTSLKSNSNERSESAHKYDTFQEETEQNNGFKSNWLDNNI